MHATHCGYDAHAAKKILNERSIYTISVYKIHGFRLYLYLPVGLWPSVCSAFFLAIAQVHISRRTAIFHLCRSAFPNSKSADGPTVYITVVFLDHTESKFLSELYQPRVGWRARGVKHRLISRNCQRQSIAGAFSSARRCPMRLATFLHPGKPS